MKRKAYHRIHRLGPVEQEVLESLSAGDLLVGFLCSAMSTRQMYRVAHRRAKRRFVVRRAIERLSSTGYIDIIRNQAHITLTGRNLLLMSAECLRNSLKTAKWDGKWRIVVFDIPQKHSDARRQIRTILKKAGFRMFQQSVWIFPHECSTLASLLNNNEVLKTRVVFGVMESIGNDAKFRKAFGLTSRLK